MPINEGEKYAHPRKQVESDTPRIDRISKERALALAALAAAEEGSGRPCQQASIVDISSALQLTGSMLVKGNLL